MVATLLLGSLGCGPPMDPAYGGQGGGRPPWLDGQSARYPEMSYLIGVGHGPTRGQCDSDAYAALAKIFNARIHQVSQDWQGHFSKVSNLGPGIKVEAMTVSQLTRVTTDKVLKGVEIKDHFNDGSEHCLAVLERGPTAANLQAEIARLDAEIKAQVERGDGAATPTARFMAYARAMEVLQEREALNVDLRIVEYRGRGVPPPVDFPALVAKFTQTRGKIKVGLKLTGSKAVQIQTCLAEQLAKHSISVLEGTSDVDVMIHGKIGYEKAGFIGGSQMVRANVDLRLTDVENGRTLGAFHDSIKVGRPTLQASVQLAVFKLCQQVMPTLTSKIRSSFK